MSGLRPIWSFGGHAYESEHLVCEGCGDLLPLMRHQGNPRVWCGEACRLRDYRERRRVRDNPNRNTTKE